MASELSIRGLKKGDRFAGFFTDRAILSPEAHLDRDDIH